MLGWHQFKKIVCQTTFSIAQVLYLYILYVYVEESKSGFYSTEWLPVRVDLMLSTLVEFTVVLHIHPLYSDLFKHYQLSGSKLQMTYFQQRNLACEHPNSKNYSSVL